MSLWTTLEARGSLATFLLRSGISLRSETAAPTTRLTLDTQEGSAWGRRFEVFVKCSRSVGLVKRRYENVGVLSGSLSL